ncbi:MAG: hypothetical protein H0T69_19470 [Thermoleophilaceae bacterium]|nr:hypothetical protein [Thermoleophilaceae bacterium]
MSRTLSNAPREPGTPDDVKIYDEAREPVEDSTLGIEVKLPPAGPAPHRLVAVGDSLTQGFMSLAVRATHLSYPAMIARELGWFDEFRFPTFDGPGGLPLDLEWLLRGLEEEFGDEFELHETVKTVLTARRMLENHEDFWERGPGARTPRTPGINHNLAIYGWDLRDSLSRDAELAKAEMTRARDNFWPSMPQNSGSLSALRVLDSARTESGEALTPLEAAAALGTEGIETLIVYLGANNALATVLTLDVVWSGRDYADLEAKKEYTVWTPTHFASELRQVARAVRPARARHVLWLTVPHVTIAPIAKGVGGKVSETSRYFHFYTRPWVADDAFMADPDRYPNLTAGQARAVDSAIDQYNEAIVAEVTSARDAGLDWRVVDVCGVLDRLAVRRYVETPGARPEWWTPYELPEELEDTLGFTPTTRFLRSGPDGITQGGLVSLDGVHPTTAGYSIVAHECMKVMIEAGVEFRAADGSVRQDARLDFAGAARADTLLTKPLRSLESNLDLLGWLDNRFALIAAAERAMRRQKRA